MRIEILSRVQCQVREAPSAAPLFVSPSSESPGGIDCCCCVSSSPKDSGHAPKWRHRRQKQKKELESLSPLSLASMLSAHSREICISRTHLKEARVGGLWRGRGRDFCTGSWPWVTLMTFCKKRESCQKFPNFLKKNAQNWAKERKPLKRKKV